MPLDINDWTDPLALAEALAERPDAQCFSEFDTGHWSDMVASGGRPIVHGTIYEPRGYEPNYAYPLVVWFHDAGGNEAEMASWIREISQRNYVGLGLRGPLPDDGLLPERRRWSSGVTLVSWLETDLTFALQQLRRKFNIHSERICVAGYGQGGTIALRMMLRRPEWFGAAISLNGPLDEECRLERFGCYGGKPLFLGSVGSDDPRLDRSRHLLHAGGFDVTTDETDFSTDSIRRLQRSLDAWLLTRLCGATIVT